MANAGLHALAGVLTKNAARNRAWLFLGVILGNMFPDLDNYAVAVATVAGGDTHGLHRTFTHSVFTILAVLALFHIIALVRGDDRWRNLGTGLGIGIAMHMALDLVIWFNGVPLFWPLGSELNFWENVAPPDWLMTFVASPAELLFFGLYFLWLWRTALAKGTDTTRQRTARAWMLASFILFAVFLPLAYMDLSVFTIAFGAVYLVSLTAAFVMTIRMRTTVEAA